MTNTTNDYKDILVCASQIIQDRLYFVTVRTTIRPKQTPNTYYFSTDEELIYNNFYSDFGPLNLAHLYRFCSKLNKILTSQQSCYKNKKIVYYTKVDGELRANAAFLIASYAIIYLKYSAQDAYNLVAAKSSSAQQHPPYTPFRDASVGVAQYTISLLDCLEGVEKALELNFFNFDDFNVERYEHYEQVVNGDFNWLVPEKFLAFCGPHDGKTDNGYSMHTPSFYISYFKSHKVSAVVRLNKKAYDASIFTNSAIKHKDLFFVDGSTPPEHILRDFLSYCDEIELDMGDDHAISVHCKAGLGRTGSLIACYMMRRWGFTALQAIAWLRICRPGSVIGHQQTWLISKQPEMWRQGAKIGKVRWSGKWYKSKRPFPMYSVRQEKLIKSSKCNSSSNTVDIENRDKTASTTTTSSSFSVSNHVGKIVSKVGQIQIKPCSPKSSSKVYNLNTHPTIDYTGVESVPVNNLLTPTQGDKLNEIKMGRRKAAMINTETHVVPSLSVPVLASPAVMNKVHEGGVFFKKKHGGISGGSSLLHDVLGKGKGRMAKFHSHPPKKTVESQDTIDTQLKQSSAHDKCSLSTDDRQPAENDDMSSRRMTTRSLRAAAAAGIPNTTATTTPSSQLR